MAELALDPTLTWPQSSVLGMIEHCLSFDQPPGGLFQEILSPQVV